MATPTNKSYPHALRKTNPKHISPNNGPRYTRNRSESRGISIVSIPPIRGNPSTFVLQSRLPACIPVSTCVLHSRSHAPSSGFFQGRCTLPRRSWWECVPFGRCSQPAARRKCQGEVALILALDAALKSSRRANRVRDGHRRMRASLVSSARVKELPGEMVGVAELCFSESESSCRSGESSSPGFHRNR